MIKWILAKLGLFTNDEIEYHRLQSKLRLCQSPIERQFLLAADPILSQYGTLTPQYQVLQYSVDFAIPECRIAIELDGYDWHSSKEQLTADSRRQRAITAEGWTVVRFTGSEVYNGAAACVAEVESIINRQSGRR